MGDADQRREMDRLISEAGLDRVRDAIRAAAMPAIGLELGAPTPDISGSKFGGAPRLPVDLHWPRHRRRPLDYLLQIRLENAAPLDPTGLLPKSGWLAFFYDLDDQPWGYDPKHLDGFRVVHFPDGDLKAYPVPDPDYALAERSVTFRRRLSLPVGRSRAFKRLREAAQMKSKEIDKYGDFAEAFHEQEAGAPSAPKHQMFGHSWNVQGDMQLEAQLVTNGINCGSERGYRHPRRALLEPGADEWLLLLQIDSDDHAEIMWGDDGMIYFWIRQDDLRAGRFDKAWMTLQCF